MLETRKALLEKIKLGAEQVIAKALNTHKSAQEQKWNVYHFLV